MARPPFPQIEQSRRSAAVHSVPPHPKPLFPAAEKKTLIKTDAPFGKSRKGIPENIKCFYVQSIKCIQTPLPNRTKKIIGALMKYYNRVSKYLKNDDEVLFFPLFTFQQHFL
jgi:hypothetical protein